EQQPGPSEHAASSQTLQRLARAGLALERVLDRAPHDDKNIVGAVAGGVNSLAGAEVRAPRERRDALKESLGTVLKRCGVAQRSDRVVGRSDRQRYGGHHSLVACESSS